MAEVGIGAYLPLKESTYISKVGGGGGNTGSGR